jgi:hypothetical protein
MKPEENVFPSINEELAALRKRPTLVVGLGAASIKAARVIASTTGLPYGVSVDAAVTASPSGTVIGVVSGSDDLSFWNSVLVHELGLTPSMLQECAQLSRLQAVRKFRSLTQTGVKPIPSELDHEVVLCVFTGSLTPCVRYQLALLRQRRPDSIVLLADDPAAGSLVGSGLVEEMILLQIPAASNA